MRCIIYRLNDEQIKLIRKYHRNRGVGVPRFEDIPRGKCFVPVDLPEFISDGKEFETPAEMVVFLSSIYLAPVVTSNEYLNEFENFAAKEIRAKNFDIREFLRHLRISEYSMIDFYLSNEKISVEEFINKDIKRFWRITNERGKIVGYYLFLNSKIFSIVLSMP